MKKLFHKILKILENNFKIILTFFILLFILTMNFPYYIEAPGGIIDISKRINLETKYESKGSLNMAYVVEFKATIPTLIMSKFKKNWDVIKKNEVILENENEDKVYFRDKLLLDEANQNAIVVAYTKANKKIDIISTKLYITYIDKLAKTDLEIGDEIEKIDGISVKNKEDIVNIIKDKKAGTKIEFIVKNKNKELKKYAEIFNYKSKNIIGLMINEKKEIAVDPKISFTFKESESGPSGGFMMSLAIYNSLIKEDISNGLKIVGTGTIDINGNVGEIAGVKYKLSGAEKAKANIFFAPEGNNYEEALKLKNENDYKIEVISISNIDEAIEYLKNNK